MKIDGVNIGEATIAKLRDLDARGGWVTAVEWFEIHGAHGNRLPYIVQAGLMRSVGLCLLSDADDDDTRGRVRGCYVLTDKGRALLRGKL